MATSQDEAPARPRRGLAEKRRAILDGARTVFGRDGYTRAGIDAIAKEAGVSTRTIYNHFADKKQLFLTVIQESAAQVRDAQIADIEHHLGKIVDLEADLTALGLALAAPEERFDAHFALVRQIQAEVGHMPDDVIEAWQRTGPRPVRAELTRRLAELAGRGMLDLDDPDRAASHFVLLAATEVTERTFRGARPLPASQVQEIVTAGVRVFLRAYRT